MHVVCGRPERRATVPASGEKTERGNYFRVYFYFYKGEILEDWKEIS